MIIGISGKARSGKDTFATMLAKALAENGQGIYVLMAYAHALKVAAQRDFDLSYAQLWGDKKEVEDKRYKKLDGSGFWTGREIMQEYGQFFRSIDSEFWVNKLFDTIEDKEYERVIVTDVRQPNEVDAILSHGGYHIRIVRPVKNKIHNEEHISETALDNGYKVDITILNSGTLKDLENKVIGVVNTIKSMESLRITLKEKYNGKEKNK